MDKVICVGPIRIEISIPVTSHLIAPCSFNFGSGFFWVKKMYLTCVIIFFIKKTCAILI